MHRPWNSGRSWNRSRPEARTGFNSRHSSWPLRWPFLRSIRIQSRFCRRTSRLNPSHRRFWSGLVYWPKPWMTPCFPGGLPDAGSKGHFWMLSPDNPVWNVSSIFTLAASKSQSLTPPLMLGSIHGPAAAVFPTSGSNSIPAFRKSSLIFSSTFTTASPPRIRKSSTFTYSAQPPSTGPMHNSAPETAKQGFSRLRRMNILPRAECFGPLAAAPKLSTGSWRKLSLQRATAGSPYPRLNRH